MKIGSLFSGSGALELAVKEVFGGDVVWQSEVNKDNCKILEHNFPQTLNLGDLTKTDWHKVQKVDVICGGFPCQDVSISGSRAGLSSETRSGLWYFFSHAINIIKPQYVVIENVRGLLSATSHRDLESRESNLGDRSILSSDRAIGAVLGDLAQLGYDAQWSLVSAAEIGAPHERYRIFILGNKTNNKIKVNDLTEVHYFLDKNVKLLPTPVARDSTGSSSPADFKRNSPNLPAVSVELIKSWGEYEEAILRWQKITRVAPKPTQINKNGNNQLSAKFSEWMMGWQDGWVTSTEIGITRRAQLFAIGNGVVIQQAVSALKRLIGVMNERR